MRSVRPYREEDWTAIKAIHDAARRNELALAGLPEAFIPLAQAAVTEGLFEYQVDVALEGSDVVGFAAYTEEELAWLYVDPGRVRQGLGKMLVNHALSQMKRPATVEVLVGNIPALTLYQQCGFVLQQTLSGHMPGNEAFEVTVHVLTINP